VIGLPNLLDRIIHLIDRVMVVDFDDDRARHATQAWKRRPEAKEPVSANAM
jgi:hypothetical protein